VSRSLVDSTAENERNSIKQFILAALLKSHSPSLKAVKDACVRELVAANTTARVIFFGSIVSQRQSTGIFEPDQRDQSENRMEKNKRIKNKDEARSMEHEEATPSKHKVWE